LSNDLNPDTWIGLTFPLGRNEGVGFFNQSKTLVEQSMSNLENLLKTIPGERVSQPLFGSKLHHILFEQIDGDIEEEIKSAIDDAVKTWLPYITISDVSVNQDMTNPNLISVRIKFSTTLDPENLETLTLPFNTTPG
jgi:phage baseplate assembly protein W